MVYVCVPYPQTCRHSKALGLHGGWGDQMAAGRRWPGWAHGCVCGWLLWQEWMSKFSYNWTFNAAEVPGESCWIKIFCVLINYVILSCIILALFDSYLMILSNLFDIVCDFLYDSCDLLYS